MVPSLRHPHVHPFTNMDVAHLLASRAASRSDHPFLIWAPFEGARRVWTYARFYHDVCCVAAGFKARGVKPGDRVLIHLENCPESLLSWYACAHLGAVAVTTNTKSVENELNYFMSFADIAGAVTQPKFSEQVGGAKHPLKWLAVTETNAGAPVTGAQSPEKSEAFEALYADAADAPLRPADPSLDVGIQYTSGTTSRPKGVVWTHANALWGGKVSAMHENLRADDIHLVHLPLFHTNAQSYSILATLWAGATAVLQPRFSASRFWDASMRHRCTWTSMVPFCVRALMDQPVPEHHYRCWGGAVAAPPFDPHFGVRSIGWWGMTETITHGIVTDPFNPSVSMSIGKPSPAYQIAILRDNGDPVEFGETGELKIHGTPGLSIFREYLNNPEATANSYDDEGWFITGDRVTLLESGDIAFADRDKDILKVGGENVAASEVERVIQSVPGVVECAVVGKPDEMLDEAPVAFVIGEGGDGLSDALIASITVACETNLSDFKLPKEIFIVDELPRATLGKIAKAELRKKLEPAG